jgi:MSHA biogenesis protein MshM
MKILQHFGLKHLPLGKASTALWQDPPLTQLDQRFQALLEYPGIGLLTGEPGVGKTAALRRLAQGLNPHRFVLVYLPETDFGRLDLYRGLALALGLQPAHRRAALWRELKARIQALAADKHQLPVWIIDEAQHLPNEFFRDLPAFLNFAFDSRDLMTVWLARHPSLAQTLKRAPDAALHSRIRAQVRLEPIRERERFAALIAHAFAEAGCTHPLLADSGLELLRQASQGLPRLAAHILQRAMELAVGRNLNHLPDELIQHAYEEMR